MPSVTAVTAGHIIRAATARTIRADLMRLFIGVPPFLWRCSWRVVEGPASAADHAAAAPEPGQASTGTCSCHACLLSSLVVVLWPQTSQPAPGIGPPRPCPPGRATSDWVTGSQELAHEATKKADARRSNHDILVSGTLCLGDTAEYSWRYSQEEGSPPHELTCFLGSTAILTGNDGQVNTLCASGRKF
jgi:hypothetical protein